MSTDIEVSKLKINVLSKDQYDTATLSNEELYFVEDTSVTFVIAVSSTAPATGSSGDKYCNTSTNKVYTYNGTTWVNPVDLIKNCFYADSVANKLYVYNGTTLVSVNPDVSSLNYNTLTNKPSINSVTLTGNKTQADLGIKTYAAFPADFVTSGTLAEIVASIKTSSGRGKGNAYLGTISGSCMPYGSGNGECKVEYMTDNIAVLTLNSSNTPPYNWVYNTDASNLSPPDYTWKHYIPQYETELPTRDVPNNTIVQYVGSTTTDYKTGYFYRANTIGYTCTWHQWNVQPTEGADTKITTMLNTLYPVGSIYIGTQATCPLLSLISGSTWERIEGRYLLASGTLAGTSESYSATHTVASGLPDHNHTLTLATRHGSDGHRDGISYFSDGDVTDGGTPTATTSNASASNSIYGQSGAVRAPGYVVNVWRRTA